MDLFSFGKYTNTPSADQSTSLSALTNNDLQVGMGTADNTGSRIEFANGAIEHANGLAIINFIAKQGPEYYYYDGDTYNWTTKTGTASTVRAASTNIVTYYPSSDFSGNIPYTKSATQYMAIVKPSQNTTFQSNAIRSWSLTYNVARNDKKIQDVNIQRDGKNLGWVYSYKGAVETFTASETGTYKLEVWGAEGLGNPQSYNNSKGGLGGYSYGNISLSSGTPLYVCVGQRPQESSNGGDNPGGFNGGGTSVRHSGYVGGGGGGATHIAQISKLGVLVNYSSRPDYVLIVAGGGGGSDDYGIGSTGDDGTGGYGGGTNGGNAYDNGILITGSGSAGCGGSASSGYAFGQGGSSSNAPNDAGGGGGGWYGGYGGDGNSMGGGGGSGHIGAGVTGETIAGNTSFPSPSGGTETGHTGNGYAIITQVSY